MAAPQSPPLPEPADTPDGERAPEGVLPSADEVMAALPAGLAARPVDERRGIPIPWMNMRPENPNDIDGEPTVPDYTAIWAPTVLKCAEQRLCGICGGDLGYRFAFIGGPKSAANRSYSDPPFCLPCATAAMTLCPHIAIGHHQRAPEHRLAEGTSTPSGFDASRSEEWVMGITRDFKLQWNRGVPVFKAAPFTQTRRFAYHGRTLVEITDVT